MEGRHNDPTVMLCPDCNWTGPLKDCTHAYKACSDENVEPASYCPSCGCGDISPKE